MMLQQRIEQYYAHIQDVDYIDALFKSAPLEGLFDALAAMLQSGNKQQILAAYLFIRDASISMPRTIAQPFSEAFHESALIELLHKNVFSDMWWIRGQTVVTIGKVGLKSSVGVLRDAFDYYLERDPLSLPGLLLELTWLGAGDGWDLIAQMAHNTSALTRWAVLSTYLFPNCYSARADEQAVFAELQLPYLELFLTDSFQPLRQEAAYRVHEFRFAQTLGSLSKSERKKARKLVQLDAPAVDFGLVEIRFIQYMSETHKADYSIAVAIPKNQGLATLCVPKFYTIISRMPLTSAKG